MTTREILINANKYKTFAALLTSEQKNNALFAMADGIEAAADKIISANEKDVAAAKGKISEVMIDRLRLTSDRIKGMADGMREVAALPDPVGRVLGTVNRPSGIKVTKVSVPLGVVAII